MEKSVQQRILSRARYPDGGPVVRIRRGFSELWPTIWQRVMIGLWYIIENGHGGCKITDRRVQLAGSNSKFRNEFI